MPFPDPFALGMIILLIVIFVSSTCQNLFRKYFYPSKDKASAPEKVESSYDPFADPPESDRHPGSVKITTKYVEGGSRTEELTFDWIASPFGLKSEDAIDR